MACKRLVSTLKPIKCRDLLVFYKSFFQIRKLFYYAVVYDRTWDVSGGRRPLEAAAAAVSLRETFESGELRRGGGSRRRWGAHFVAVTTSGSWAMAPGKDGDDAGVGAALESVIERLGGGRDARAAVRAAMAVPGQPSGLAVLAACSRGGAVQPECSSP
jgi:hypothetical protein